MKNKPSFLAIIGIVIATLIVGCGLYGAAWFLYYSFGEKQNEAKCSPLPEDFSTSQLIGTWVAGLKIHSDTLIIKADGTYKQIVHVENYVPSIDYESGWQSWHLSQSSDRITYIHLKGMRFCGMNPDIPCDKPIEGVFDFCHNESINVFNEDMLVVVPVYKNGLFGAHTALDHIYLTYQSLDTGWSYFLQEP